MPEKSSRGQRARRSQRPRLSQGRWPGRLPSARAEGLHVPLSPFQGPVGFPGDPGPPGEPGPAVGVEALSPPPPPTRHADLPLQPVLSFLGG